MDKNSHNIKYLFIGNVLTNKALLEIVVQKNEKALAECNKIFNSVSKLKETSYEQRNKIGNGETVYFFIIKKNENGTWFFLLEANNNYPERSAFELADEVFNLNLANAEPTSLKSSVNTVLEKYQRAPLLENVMSDINEVKIEINKSIQSQISNLDNLKDLKDRSDNIKLGAEAYKKDAKDLRCATWCQNCKWTIIIISALLLLILIIVLSVVLSKKEETPSSA